MGKRFWRRDSLEQALSAYLDGELDTRDTESVLEHLALNSAARTTLENLDRAERLARLAVAPVSPPDLEAAVSRIQAATAGSASGGPSAASGPSRPRRALGPALLASAGLLVTAGVALAELRRRRVL